jgi:glycosyltransferase involved in cell wall biosynthesis
VLGNAPRLLYVVTEDWFFLSHRLPMARAARAAGYEVHVACNVDAGAAAIAREGFILHPVAFARGRLAPAGQMATIMALRAVHRAVDPDLVHHVALQASILGSIAALGGRAKCINAITGFGYAFASTTPKARLARALLRPLMRRLLGRRNSIVLVQNPDDRATLQALRIPPERIELIPGSGVDVAAFTPMPEPPPPTAAAFVGRLLDDKGVRVLVAAHRLLRQRGIHVLLFIAGAPDPANPASITAREAESWNGEPGIAWLGHVTDIASLWARAHIAVLPPRGGEGLPKSLLEAAACGRPMIATNVRGCREIAIAGETALLVPPDDPAALANAIETLAGARELRARFGLAARRLVEQRFAAEKIGAAAVVLYDQLLGRAPLNGGQNGMLP